MKKVCIFLGLWVTLTVNLKAGERKNAFISQPNDFLSAHSSMSVNSMEDIFHQVDHKYLKSVIDSKDEAGLKKIQSEMALKISDYIYEKYKEDIRDEINEQPEATILLGFLFMMREKGIKEIPNEIMQGRESDFDCLMGAVGGILGLGEIQSLYHDFTHGVSSRTVLRAAKTMLRRVAIGFTVVMAIYELGECFNWW